MLSESGPCRRREDELRDYESFFPHSEAHLCLHAAANCYLRAYVNFGSSAFLF